MQRPQTDISSDLPRLTQFDFHHRLAAQEGVCLVAFGSPGCGGCRHLSRILLEVRQKRQDWQAFEVNVQEDPGLAAEFEVFHLPTLFLFHGGEFHCELAAEARPSSIIAHTLAALQRPAAEAP